MCQRAPHPPPPTSSHPREINLYACRQHGAAKPRGCYPRRLGVYFIYGILASIQQAHMRQVYPNLAKYSLT